MFHPNAYLKNVHNVRYGLVARTKLLGFLENQFCSASELANKTGLSYSVVTYHLRLLYRDGIVEHKGRRRYIWLSTGVGQTRLV